MSLHNANCLFSASASNAIQSRRHQRLELQLADMCGMFWRAVTAVCSLLVIEMQQFLAAAYNNFAHLHAAKERARKCIVCNVQTSANTTVLRQNGSDAALPDYNVD